MTNLKLKKNLFKKVNIEDERQRLREQYSGKAMIKKVAMAYDELVFKYSGKKIWTNSPSHSERRRKENQYKINKLIRILNDLNTTAEIYIRFQFETMAGLYKKKRPLTPYPFLSDLITDAAVTRYKQFVESSGVPDSFVSTKQRVDVYQAIVGSAKKFYARLKAVKIDFGLTKENVVGELKTLVIANVISDLYVYSSPLVSKETLMLLEIKRAVEGKLTRYQKEAIKSARKKFFDMFEDEEIRKLL